MREVIYKDDAIEAIRNVEYGGSAMRKVLFIKAVENVPPAPPVERLIAKFSFDEEKMNVQESCENEAEITGRSRDTIYRQAAIDALEKVAELYPWRVPGDRDSYSQYNEAWQDALNRADNEIEALPSAQPEPQWTPCSERLPDKPDGDYEYELDASLIQAEEYIVMIKDADLPTTLFWTGDKWFEPCDGDPINYSVVAWMPLPDPYRKNGE